MEPYLIGDQRGAAFDLSLKVLEAESQIKIFWRYNTDLFDAATIASMAEHFQVLLAGIVDNPDCNIAQLPLLTEVERDQLLVEWNNTKRTVKSKEYAQSNRGHFADPRTVSGFSPTLKEMVYPIVVERSAGCKLWDLDGNEYIDLINGFGSSLFGYLPDFIKEAIAAQLEKGIEIGAMTPLAAEAAKLFCELTNFDRATFCNSGSEAVLGAMRIARTVTNHLFWG